MDPVTTPIASPTAPRQREADASLYGLYMLGLAACMFGNLLIRIGTRAGWLPGWGRVALALGAVIPLIVAAVWFWRMLRRDLDEMLQRILLEGLAFALVIYVPIAAIYVNLKTAGVWLPRLDPPDILLTPAILAGVGIALAWRRYR